MSGITKKEIDNSSNMHNEEDSFVCANEADAVTEEYNFEMSKEVKDRIEHAQNKHCYINEGALLDLETLEKPGMWCRFVKRTIDILVSFFAMLFLLHLTFFLKVVY